MRSTKVVAVCIFNELQAAGLFLVLDGTSTRTDPSICDRKLVNNAVLIRNESLFVVSAAATMHAFQLKHTLRLHMPAGYQIWTIEYGKSSCSMGNTIGVYTRCIIKCNIIHRPDKELDIQSDLIFVNGMVHLSQE